MGLGNQIIRGIKEFLKDLRKKFSRQKRKRKDEPTVLHPSWSKKDGKAGKPGQKKPQIIMKQKKRIPGLLMFKRLLAGFLFLVNFVLSQFLLGSLGEAGQPIFILFLLNAFIMADYIWKTRRKAE